jgi:hypothetical protein
MRRITVALLLALVLAAITGRAALGHSNSE